MTLLLLLAAAWASPVGEPVVDPAVGRLQLKALGDGEVTPLRDLQCSGEACGGSWEGGGVGLEGQLALLKGLGIYGGVAQVSGQLVEAEYLGSGTAWRLGLRGALPLGASRAWIAAGARVELALTEGATLDSGDRQRAETRTGAGTLLLAHGGPDDGLTSYLGADVPFWWMQDVMPLGRGQTAAPVELWMVPQTPAALVAGVATTSEPLTPAWGAAVRGLAGAELRLGGTHAVAAWAGVSF